MIATLVFSRNRPPQLDLCLRSIRAHLPDLHPVHVLYRADGLAYEDGYTLCEAYHPDVVFVRERDFRSQVLSLLGSAGSEYATFLCDDDVAFRPNPLLPAALALETNPDMLCFSLRLGANCSQCYSLRRTQSLPTVMRLGRPERRFLIWDWAAEGVEGDWAYPGSTDATIFRRQQLLRLIGYRDRWSGPNELEDALNQACQTALLPMMGSFPDSCVTGVPTNRVNTSHLTNRHGERYLTDPMQLNDRYLKGARLALDSVLPEMVDAAHVEVALKWAA